MVFYSQNRGHDRPKQHILSGRVEILRAEGACIVCGDPSGNCVGDSHDGTPSVNWGAVEDTSPKTFYVTDDVFEDRWITPKRKTRVVAAARGSWITEAKARNLGLA
jgi:hypothetical protein